MKLIIGLNILLERVNNIPVDNSFISIMNLYEGLSFSFPLIVMVSYSVNWFVGGLWFEVKTRPSPTFGEARVFMIA